MDIDEFIITSIVKLCKKEEEFLRVIQAACSTPRPDPVMTDEGKYILETDCICSRTDVYKFFIDIIMHQIYYFGSKIPPEREERHYYSVLGGIPGRYGNVEYTG